MTTQTTTDIQALSTAIFLKVPVDDTGAVLVTVAMDGFDTAIIVSAVPLTGTRMGRAEFDLGPVMSAALVGLAVGALTAGPMADRIGRKVLVLSILVFGGFSLITAFATSLTQLTVLRFLTGLGLGLQCQTPRP